MKVTASMASLGEREGILEKTVSSIINQVHHLNLYLNLYSGTPSFITPYMDKVTVHHADNTLGDAGKFFWAHTIDGYHAVLDDDIIYPKNYIKRLKSKCALYNDKAVLGVHGVTLKNPPVSNYFKNRKVMPFCMKLAADTPCHILGTGTLFYHSSAVSISVEDFKSANNADLWFAIKAQEQRIPMICIARKPAWLIENQELKLKKLPSIYLSNVNDGSLQTEIVNQISWTCHQPPPLPIYKKITNTASNALVTNFHLRQRGLLFLWRKLKEFLR